MFTSREKLLQRTGKNTVGRYDFLKLLVTEFKTTKSKEAKEQVLANLANFAYDPLNYGYMRQLRVLDLFLHALSDNNSNLVQFAAGGICNLCLDSINRVYILRNQGVQLMSSLLFSQDEEIILSAVTTLMFLITPESKHEITAPEIVQRISHLAHSENNRIKNVATVFLRDYCEIKSEENCSKET